MLPSWQFPQPQEPAPPRDADPYGGRGGGKGFRPPNISTTRMILGFVGVFVLVGLVAVLVSTDSSQAEVAIVSPKDSAVVEAGKVPVRIRVQDVDVANWELFLRGPHTAGEWMLLARGQSEPLYSAVGSGLHFIDLVQPGAYELTLKVTDSAGNVIEQLTDFRIEE